MQDYVTNSLMTELPSGGTLTCAAIFRLDGCLWYKSEDFPELESHEINKIIEALDEPNTIKDMGMKLADVRYMLIPSEAGQILRCQGRSGGKQHYLIVEKTNTSMIIGFAQEPVTLSELSGRVHDVAILIVGDDGL
jgi:hypothetical protein